MAHNTAPGPLAGAHRPPGSPPPVPQAVEVERARLLANGAWERLAGTGVTHEDVRALADTFVAEDRGEGTEAFVGWVLARAASGRA